MKEEDLNDKTITVMPIKRPRVVKMGKKEFSCPVTGCDWSCTNSRSYSRHYDGKHTPSFKFICKWGCGAGQDRSDMAEEHAGSCMRSREANLLRRGTKPRYATPRQERQANPADPEEAVQELEERLEVVEREKKQLKEKFDVEKEQMKEKYEVEKKQLNEKFEAEKRELWIEKEELKVYVGKLEARLKEMGEQEHAMDVDKEPEVDKPLEEEDEPLEEEGEQLEDNNFQLVHAMDVDKEPEVDKPLEEEEGEQLEDNNFQLVLSEDEEVLVEDVGEMLEKVVEEVDELEEDKEDEGGDQLPAPPSPPGQLPLRRSQRKSPATLLKEKQEAVEAKLLVTDDARHGLQVVDIAGKGRGVEATRPISKGDFVVEYTGELVDAGVGHAMEVIYSMDMTKGSYSYYFTYNSTKYCVDATEESGRFGRLLNHSKNHPTCVPKVVEVAGTPRLIFLAKHDIKAGQEVTFNYGDQSKESLSACPWLAL
jgi:hypothetical protein